MTCLRAQRLKGAALAEVTQYPGSASVVANASSSGGVSVPASGSGGGGSAS